MHAEPLKSVANIIKATFLVALAIGVSTHILFAQDKPSDIESLKPIVNPTTIVIAQMDMQRMTLPRAVQEAIAANKDAQPLLEWIDSLKTTFSPMTNDRLTLVVDVPFTEGQAPLRFIARKPANLDMAKLNEGLAAFRFSPAEIQGDHIATAPIGVLAESNKLLVSSATLPINDQAISAALATVQEMPVQILFLPPRYLWSTYADLMPRLPDIWGGTPTTTLTDGIQWAAIGFDPASMRLQVTIQSKDAAAAQRLVSELPKLLQRAASMPMVLSVKPALASIKLDEAVVKQDRIELTATNLQELGVSTNVVMKLLGGLIDPLSTREKMNRFKQLALAIHNYESANKVLPPNQAARGADGKSWLSWRVHILPYIDEVKLYSEFKLNEPWDSPHNIKLLDKMPDIFSSFPVPVIAKAMPKGYTTILAPAGEGTMFGGNKPVPFGQVKDGLSNTIFFVEVKPEAARPWTAPLEYEFLPGDPASDLAIGSDGQFLCAMGDGSVVLLPGNLPKETLLHLFQMNDGQVIVLP